MNHLFMFGLGVAIGIVGAIAFTQIISAEPQFIWRSEKGGLMKVTPANTYQAIDLAAVHCSGFRRYPVLTETTVKAWGTIRFDCITHREQTGPLANPRTP